MIRMFLGDVKPQDQAWVGWMGWVLMMHGHAVACPSRREMC